MIKGIGTDIIEIDRVKEAVEKNQRFLTKHFTEDERDLFEKRSFNPSTIAANFATKEAVSKALGTGFRSFSLLDIEVLRDRLGKPYVNLYNQAKTLKNELSIDHIHVTISHNRKDVVAFVVAEEVIR
ncbi:holo-ACP synthase [Vallitalea okinawensis]|uniref:holo-ACP synthase n=1 Tax=Vallitalea okinawensis TaxID=2078660 RepID=UPI000CFBFE8A|nr:holo-ACP synthase [Vallitalea okinawensis]